MFTYNFFVQYVMLNVEWLLSTNVLHLNYVLKN